MDVRGLSSHYRSIRANIRAFLMTATRAELEQELDLSVRMSDEFRAECIRELIEESKGENS